MISKVGQANVGFMLNSMKKVKREGEAKIHKNSE